MGHLSIELSPEEVGILIASIVQADGNYQGHNLGAMTSEDAVEAAHTALIKLLKLHAKYEQ